MKRIKGDARGELATGPFFDIGDCRGYDGNDGAGAGWSDREYRPGPGMENYYGRHPTDGDRGDERPNPRRSFKMISGRY